MRKFTKIASIAMLSQIHCMMTQDLDDEASLVNMPIEERHADLADWAHTARMPDVQDAEEELDSNASTTCEFISDNDSNFSEDEPWIDVKWWLNPIPDEMMLKIEKFDDYYKNIRQILIKAPKDVNICEVSFALGVMCDISIVPTEILNIGNDWPILMHKVNEIMITNRERFNKIYHISKEHLSFGDRCITEENMCKLIFMERSWQPVLHTLYLIIEAQRNIKNAIGTIESPYLKVRMAAMREIMGTPELRKKEGVLHVLNTGESEFKAILAAEKAKLRVEFVAYFNNPQDTLRLNAQIAESTALLQVARDRFLVEFKAAIDNFKKTT